MAGRASRLRPAPTPCPASPMNTCAAGWKRGASSAGPARERGRVPELPLHEEKPPCLVFEDIPGTLKGSRVLVNFFGGKRQNMTLGFPSDLSKIELSEGFRSHYLADLS